MRIANYEGRLVVVAGGEGHKLVHDVEKNSGGRFGPEPQAIYEDWDAFTGWAASPGRARRGGAGARWEGGAPVGMTTWASPGPGTAPGVRHRAEARDHAAESGLPVPAGEPPVFTKFPSCITGPHGDIELPPGGHVDWEVELVAVVGRRARHVPAERGLEYVAGYAVGQDISERVLQLAATPPQFSMGKSLPGFGPVGPWLVTLDDLDDPGDLALGCEINGEPVQSSRTSQLIFSVPALVANLSASVPLLPGDVIFTGTPAGVGLGRDPQRWLADGDVLTSHIEGIGEMRHRFVVAPPPESSSR